MVAIDFSDEGIEGMAIGESMTTARSIQTCGIAELKAFAAKKEKVAQVLTDADLADEAEHHQKAAEKARAEAQAIENHLPEPNPEQLTN